MLKVVMIVLFILPLAIPLVVLGLSRRRMRALAGMTTVALPSSVGNRMVWSLVYGMFLGLMVATAGGALFPQIIQASVPLVCDGTTNLESRGYSYKPGQAGVTHTITCDAGDGSPLRDITLRAVAASAVLYGLIASLLVFLLWPLVMGSAPVGTVQAISPGATGPTAGLGALETFLRNAGQSSAGQPWVVVNRNPSSDRALAALQELMKNADHVTLDSTTLDSTRLDATTPDATTTFDPQLKTDPITDATTNPGARLQALNHLHDKGLITTSEYEAKRAQILSQL